MTNGGSKTHSQTKESTKPKDSDSKDDPNKAKGGQSTSDKSKGYRFGTSH